ncbi:hypothetical protein NDU88_008369 [Pleurodeles waltl]|uniref:Uncharacterized protein n=1 Tax=Pleurodeles waltl TaxID=8319 RepID=A0AAV7N4S3_PLEWA|nr:hypothetical protein NDU88_008369 [Pleurodeles waltl]
MQAVCPDCSAPKKTFHKASPRIKGKRHASSKGDVAPWVRPSLSESSFTDLLHSIPLPTTCTDHLNTTTGLRVPGETHQSVIAEDQGSHFEKTEKSKNSREAKARRRGVGSQRHGGGKVRVVKLPPVPNVTNLSFSRNFTFSFFELPDHQSHQHLLQRQRMIQMLMKQLH